MKQKLTILLIAASIALTCMIGLLIYLISNGKENGEPSDTVVVGTTETPMDLSTEQIINDTPDYQTIEVPEEAASLYQQGAALLPDYKVTAFRTQRDGLPEGTEQELADSIVQARNLYRKGMFEQGANIISSFAATHQVADTVLGREYIAMFYDSGTMSILPSMFHEYGTDAYNQAAVKRLIQTLIDPETFLLAAFAAPTSYDYYLDKDSIYLNGCMGLYDQGLLLAPEDEHYYNASLYVDPTIICCFQIRYNDDINLFCYIVTDTSGGNHILDIENEDGTYVLPYETAGGTLPDIDVSEQIDSVTIVEHSTSETDGITELSIFQNSTHLADDAIVEIISYLHDVGCGKITSVLDGDLMLIVTDANDAIYIVEIDKDGYLTRILQDNIVLFQFVD